MSDGPKRYISDTQPIAIPPELLARYRHASERPSATEDDVRRAIADTVLDAVPCPGCGGGGKTSAERARLIEEMLDAASSIVTCPVRAPRVPVIKEDDDDSPTQR